MSGGVGHTCVKVDLLSMAGLHMRHSVKCMTPPLVQDLLLGLALCSLPVGGHYIGNGDLSNIHSCDNWW